MTVYEPAERPLAVLAVDPPVQEYVYGPTPPEAVTLAAPFEPPLQLTPYPLKLLVTLAVLVKAVGNGM